MSKFLLRRLLLLALFPLLLPGMAGAQFTRGVQMNFGKNRVQYNDFLWTFYRFTSFDTYFYLGGQELAIYTGRTAEADIAEIEKLFDYRINGRFQFMIYNRLTDLKQSNIGLEGEEQNTNTGGLTRIVGNKILVYFDGDYRHFREQIRAGVAQVMINQLMYGGSIKDRLQSAVLLNLPEWYVNGLVAYVSKGWTANEDNRMRDAMISRRFRNFNNLSGQEAQFAGTSLWNFIVETYGPSSVSNLLYMTRINRNIESGFVYVLGVPMKELSKSWYDYYQRLYFEDESTRKLPPGSPLITLRKPGRYVSQVKVSPDGNQVAWVTNELGKYKVWMYDVRAKKTRRVSKGGYKSVNITQDLSYPTLAWHPSGRYLAAIKEKKGKLWLDYYTPGKRKIKKETNKFFYFDKVLDFSFNASGSEIALSAVQKGQSDIYTFSPRTKTYIQHTKDRWDDFSPRFVLNDRYLVFSSTRIEDTLRPTPIRQAAELDVPRSTDIYLYDYMNRAAQLLRLTNTPGINEVQPMMMDSSHFSYLSDENGIYNRYAANLDSTIAYIDTAIHYRYIVKTVPQTNYSRGILQQDINPRGTRQAELVTIEGRYNIFLHPVNGIDTSFTGPLKKTAWGLHRERTLSPAPPRQEKSNTSNTTSVKVVEQKPRGNVEHPDTSSTIDINNYVFQSDFPSKKPKKEPVVVTPAADSTVAISTPSATTDTSSTFDQLIPQGPDTASYMVPKQRNYEVAFSANYVLTQLDNNLLNETYQTYTGGAVYFYPGLNALFKIGINDLFDDYRIVGGFRLSGNLNSNEYYVSYENLKHRLDRKISFYRQAREDFTQLSYFKIHTHELKYQVSWPFNDLMSLRGTAAYRHDRLVTLSTDQYNLLLPNAYQDWGSLRGELVYDNTVSTGLNLYNGLRYKVFGEMFREVDLNNSYLAVFGADVRHYLKLHRQIIWANRFAASTSIGTQKLIYYLGSTDNAFVPTDNFNYNIQIDRSQNYAFQALATNMRGFVQNIRNGNSFALINSEVRVPIFQYLINKPIRSDFIRNFQVIGFGDIGTAWTGPSPYSKNNALFRKDYDGNPITITVTKTVEPLVGGFGFGLRSRVLGYFLRADWAWGVDDGEIQDRIFYFSLGLDF